jgi:hypothetical protein
MNNKQALAIGQTIQAISATMPNEAIAFAYRQSDDLLTLHWTNGADEQTVTKAVVAYSHDVKIGLKRNLSESFLASIRAVFCFVEPDAGYSSIEIDRSGKGVRYCCDYRDTSRNERAKHMTTFASVTDAPSWVSATPFRRAELVNDFLSKLTPDTEEAQACRAIADDPAYVEEREDDREYEPVADD